MLAFFALLFLTDGCSQACSTISIVTHWLNNSSFVEISSKHHNSQTVRARDLTFWHNVLHPLCVMCHLSHVMCHVVELVGRGSVINKTYLVYFFLSTLTQCRMFSSLKHSYPWWHDFILKHSLAKIFFLKHSYQV